MIYNFKIMHNGDCQLQMYNNYSLELPPYKHIIIIAQALLNNNIIKAH